jgi:hypothetical protein
LLDALKALEDRAAALEEAIQSAMVERGGLPL